MGILRSDRVSGLGGASAINGSVRFGGDQHLRVATSTEFNLSNSNFTLECWVNFSGFDGTGFDTILMASLDGTGANTIFQFDYKNSTNNLRFIPYVSNSAVVYESSWSPSKDTWYHVAACRSGADLKLFVDGTQIGSTHNIGSQTVDGDNVPIGIGQRRGNLDRGIIGYISNLRLVVGTALYTSNFTAPTERLTNIDNTVLLCCQSPSNILKEETGKTIESVLDNLNNLPPQASHFAPDVGEDHGTTFEDNTKFDTLSYMVPPGGTTAQRGRGRGVMGGFYAAPSYTTRMDYLNIQSLGNSTQFGNLSVAKIETASCSSSTRALWAGGSVPGPTTGGTKQNTIEYATIATTSNTIDFGDLTDTIRTLAGCSNGTRGVFGGGIDDPARLNTIDYVTIASTGNAADFGDLTVQRRNISSHSSTTRGVFSGGLDPGSPGYTDVIDYITIASAGNATDFGNLTVSRYGSTGCSNSTRGLFFGGKDPSAYANTIDYITIATTGDATDFGDLTVGRNEGAGFASPTRGIMAGGESPAVNTIDYVTIATIGNAKDFGDIFSAARSQSGSTDCHGGLS